MRARIKNADGWFVSEVGDLHKLNGNWSTFGLETPFVDAQSRPFFQGDVVMMDGKAQEVEFNPLVGFMPFAPMVRDMIVGGVIDTQLDHVINLGNIHDDPGLLLRSSMMCEAESVSDDDLLDDVEE